jgi:Protein of unknown function (DUF1566)
MRYTPSNPTNQQAPFWPAWMLIALYSVGLLGALMGWPAYSKDSSAIKATPSTVKHYTLLPGGIARDKATGLEWMRCALGQTWDGKTCQGEGTKYTYDAALQAVKNINSSRSVAGKSDWRVPTHRQLASLVYCSQGTRRELIDLKDGSPQLEYVCAVDGKGGPTLAQTVFPNTPGGQGSWFWSSSPQVGVADHAWFAHFFNGYVNVGYRDNPFYVYLVRGNQPQ